MSAAGELLLIFVLLYETTVAAGGNEEVGLACLATASCLLPSISANNGKHDTQDSLKVNSRVKISTILPV